MARRRRQRRRFGDVSVVHAEKLKRAVTDAKADLGHARNAAKVGKCSAAIGFLQAAAYELGEAQAHHEGTGREGKVKGYRDLEDTADLIVRKCVR